MNPAPKVQLSYSQILQVALDAGFPEHVAVAMTAIAKRESDGVPTAFNGNAATGDESYGLWQINMRGQLGDARMKQFGITAKAELFDAKVNARAAFLTWGHNNRNLELCWYIDRPGYKERYEKHLPGAVLASLGLAA